MMLQLKALVSRNCKIFFKDKGLFFPSLIAPVILLFLFIAFLGDVYRDSIRSVVGGFPISDALVESIAGGWLFSSLLAVSTVTIAFTANIVMVQDKALGMKNDLTVAPVPSHILALSYFIAAFLCTAIISFVAMGAGFVYIGIMGWHLTIWDVLGTILDTLLLILFGTALSSCILHFISSLGGVSAVSMIVCSTYGFLCGAYMPLSQLTPWLKNVLMFLPGTYGTGLLHEHLMGSAIDAVTGEGMPAEFVASLKKGFDCTLTFLGHTVPEWICYLVLVGVTLLLLSVYIGLIAYKRRKR